MTQITYDILLDDENEYVLELKVTTLCATKPVKGSKLSKEELLTNQEHIAFVATYRFSNTNAVEKFPVPAAAAKALR